MYCDQYPSVSSITHHLVRLAAGFQAGAVAAHPLQKFTGTQHALLCDQIVLRSMETVPETVQTILSGIEEVAMAARANLQIR